MNLAILRRPRTQALLDGTIKPAGLIARWIPITDPLGWALPPREHHRDLAASQVDGGEMSISSFVQAKSRGAPLVALPVFLKRGLVQRSLFCRAASSLSSPEQLAGKKVGLVGYTSSMAVWMRGVLTDGYGVAFSSVKWFALSGSYHDGLHTTQGLTIPDEFRGKRIQAWEELDGYAHQLDRREKFLLSLLNRGALDAVVSFQARIDCEECRPLLCEERLWSLPLNSQIYPINHLFVVKTDVINESPAIVESLLAAFREARRLWMSYQSEGKREACEREMARLGYDPFAYCLGEVEKKTLEVFVSYLEREKIISRKPGLDEFFYRRD